ncbi:MAG: hypothetical protein J6I76_18860 [Oribacterium sp.]|nr:hypothetical protein [Oribacterium sp.]
MSCDVRYIDGRNHILDLISAYVKKESKKKSKKKILNVLKNRERLELALEKLDPGYFNDYK